MQPDLEAVAAEYRGAVTLQEVDASREVDTARELGVLGTPTLVAFDGDRELARLTGRRSRDELREFFAAAASRRTERRPAPARADVGLRIAAGAVLLAAGLAAGPSWVLAVVGAAVGGHGVFGLWQHRSRAGASDER
jgi:thioredoxin-like negative regulator of GroEL